MIAGTNISDETRAAKAVQQGSRMLGPWETGHCEHGKLYSYRWTWPVGATPADGTAQMGRQGCKKCREEE